MSESVSVGKKALFIVMALIPVIAVLIATEINLRSETRQWYEKKMSRNHALKNSLKIHQKSNDPLLIYELTPGAELDRQGIHYKINQAGFRDDEFPNTAVKKKPNEYRIVVLGDSVAWGWGVDMTQAWPQLLESQLQNQASKKHISVYNLAVNGYSTPQEVRILSKYGLAYQPDLVILNYVLNDPEVEDGGLSWYFESVNRIEILYKGELLFSFIANALKIELGLESPQPNNSSMDHFYLIHHSELFKNVANGFNDLADLAKKENIPLMVMVTPVFQFKKNGPYPWAEIHNQIKNLCTAHNFIFLDTQSAFSLYDSLDVSLDPIHPNVKGHEIIENVIMEKLLSSNLAE